MYVLLLGGHVFCEHFDAIFCFELANEARVPQLTRDAEVLAAAHQRIALARLSRSGDARRVKVLLLPARDRDQAV